MSFPQVQCHSYTGYCWCVTPNGRPISGTAVAHKTPRCPGRCGVKWHSVSVLLLSATSAVFVGGRRGQRTMPLWFSGDKQRPRRARRSRLPGRVVSGPMRRLPGLCSLVGKVTRLLWPEERTFLLLYIHVLEEKSIILHRSVPRWFICVILLLVRGLGVLKVIKLAG